MSDQDITAWKVRHLDTKPPIAQTSNFCVWQAYHLSNPWDWLTYNFRHASVSESFIFLLFITDGCKQIFRFVLSPRRKFCPAGCGAVTGDVSGDVSLGYRHVSTVSLFSSGAVDMRRSRRGYLRRRRASPMLPARVSDAAVVAACRKSGTFFPQVLKPPGAFRMWMWSGPEVGGGMC